MLEENKLSSPSQKTTSNPIKIALLTDADLTINAVVATLIKAQLPHFQQIVDIEEYSNLLDAKCDLDLVLYDARHSRISLDEAVYCLLDKNLEIPVIVINGESSISAAVAAIKAGATDYIPADALAELPQAIRRASKEYTSICFQSQCVAQSDRQLQKLISENADGIIVVDDRGIVRFINPAASKLLGRSPEELMGASLGFPVVNGDFLEVDIPVSPDKILVAQMRLSQIKWQGTDAFVVSLRDITQLKRAEEEIAQLLQEAQAANRAKDEFLAVLSHELRTPLNPIVGWSQLLARGNLTDAQIKQGAEIIQRNANLQTQLIEDILDVSRIIRGKLELNPTAVNLVDVIHNALETVSLTAQAKSIAIATELDEDVGLIQGDATRLQQAVWNLLSNAIKFTPHGGTVKVRLTAIDTAIDRSNHLKTKVDSSYAQIQVIDSGKGVKPEFLPYVFDYFRQAESGRSRSEGGLGLGLAIVRRLIELHGGEVSANSSGIGTGATFTIVLPILNRSNLN